MYSVPMTAKEMIVAILQERSFEIREGATKMEVVEATDFEQIALDILELLNKEFQFDPDNQ
jgi:hypothetical protein